MTHGIIKVGCATPKVYIGEPSKNAEKIIEAVKEASELGIKLLVFPELSLTGATCGDLFFTDTLIRKAEEALMRIAAETADCDMIFFVGLPVRELGKIFNCVAAVSRGEVLGFVPKSTVTDSELDDARHFAPAPDKFTLVNFGYESLMMGRDLLFECAELPSLRIGCVIGSDATLPSSPANRLVGIGATLVVNPFASAEIIGRADYRRSLAIADSGRLICAMVSAGASERESTTDMVFGGHCLISENGTVKAEKRPFTAGKIISANVDIQHLTHDRLVSKGFPATNNEEVVRTPFSLCDDATEIFGDIDPTPFIPKGDKRDATLAHILDIQTYGLAKRLKAARAKSAVIGISGGLDSCLALLVAVRAMKTLARPMTDILAVTMPCFGTTERTRGNAEILCDELGTAFKTVDIAEAVKVHFRDIGHDIDDYSVVFENAQARERTQIIMDIANGNGGIVVGTGDLSELALGWATYNGDHMSNYGVNGGVPKTLVRHLVAYCADEAERDGKTALAEVLRDILATPVSPELLPPKEGEIAQKTEDIVGPYELHDFFLYHYVRWGEEPEKILRLASVAFDGVYDSDIIAAWLKVFMRRFTTQQFKRSALPDGVKVGSVALSPRGAWMMPSDAEVWNLDL